jgi:hypothetical protein
MLSTSNPLEVAPILTALSRGRPIPVAAVQLAVLVASIICGSCASVPMARSNPTQIREVAVTFFDAVGNAKPVGERPTDAELRLSAVPGAIAGNPYRSLVSIDVSSALQIDIKPHDLELSVGELAAPLTREAIQSGLRMFPRQTRLARVSTTLSTKQNDHTITAFYDMHAKHSLVLVYVDRPCRITGTVIQPNTDSAPTTMVWNVKLSQAGLHWLAFIPEGHSKEGVTLESSISEPTVVFAPPEDFIGGAFRFN